MTKDLCLLISVSRLHSFGGRQTTTIPEEQPELYLNETLAWVKSDRLKYKKAWDMMITFQFTSLPNKTLNISDWKPQALADFIRFYYQLTADTRLIRIKFFNAK